MKMKAAGFVAAVASLLCGCVVQSLSPFYLEDAKIDASNLDGAWVGADVSDKEIRPWVFKDEASELRTFDQDNKQGEFKTVFFRVGDQVFCDLSPAELPKKAKVSEYWTLGMRPTHLLCQVDSGDGLLTLTPLDFDWLKKAIESKRVTLSHVGTFTEKDDPPLFTATPEQWKTLLEQFGGDTAAFPKKSSFALKRSVEQKEENKK